MSVMQDRAEQLFCQGYNCAQAVFVPFAVEQGMEEKTAHRLAASLGGGLAHSGEVCGAILGMLLAQGLCEGFEVPDQDTKMAHNVHVKALVDDFRKKFEHTGCEALRNVNDRSVCQAYVRYAAGLAEGTKV